MLAAVDDLAFPQPNHGLNPGESLTCTATGIAIRRPIYQYSYCDGNWLPADYRYRYPNRHGSQPLPASSLILVIVKDDGGISTKPGNTLI